MLAARCFGWAAWCVAICGGVAACSGAQDPTPNVCGGIAGIQCPRGQECVDNPADGCDPTHGGADCSGICIDRPAPTFCGGIAAIPCPQGQKCVDNPDDDCDPAHGGADCGGICVK